MNTNSNRDAGKKSDRGSLSVPAETKCNAPDAKRRSGSTGRRATEKAVFGEMTLLFCRAHHRKDTAPCLECDALIRYAWQRVEACRFADDKPFCSACTVHCFSSDRRDQTRRVMRFAGPRMLFQRPFMAIRHLLQARS